MSNAHQQTHMRSFSNFYDTLNQREMVSGVSTDKSDINSKTSLCLARLRFDTIFSRKVVLTDTHLLDGTVFLANSNQNFFSSLRRSSTDPEIPIEIRARSSDLEKALIGLVKNSDTEYLKGFVFSSISDHDARDSVSQELMKVKSDKVNSIADIAKLLVDIGVDKSNVDFIDAGWRNIIVIPVNNSTFSLLQKREISRRIAEP